MHTHMNGPNSSLEWVLTHWAHFTVLRFIFIARRSASAVLAIAIPSVCLRPSVTRRYCVKTTARSKVQFALSDSKISLVL